MTFIDAVYVAMDKQGIKTIAELCRRADDDPKPLFPAYFSKLKSSHTKSVTWERALQIIRALGMTPNEFSEIQNGGE